MANALTPMNHAQPGAGLPAPLLSSRAVRECLPTVDLQYDYHEKLRALASYTKDKDYAIASLEAQVAMAETLPEAMERGDVVSEKNGNTSVYKLYKPDGEPVKFNGNHVNLWRQLAAVPEESRQAYYKLAGTPTRNGLLNRHKVATAPKASKAAGKRGEASWSFQVGDCAALPFDDDTFDLVFCSPPYESQRDYEELEFSLSGEAWVEWAVRCYRECLRVCRGLVAWVVEGYTEDFAYSATPFLLLADLHRAEGVRVRKPCVYQRNGIPGTGGPDWLRNDWEPIICATKNGRLPWSEPTAMGKPPKQNKPRTATNRNKDGSRKNITYNDPEICNPGNIIGGLVGCGGLGWKDAHENEAPFPEWLAEFFVRSFCPVGGHVLDPFSGSGTTVSMAVKHGRNAVGVDARQSQVALGEIRLSGLTVAQHKNGQGVLI